MQITVLGAAGGAGQAIVAELAHRGHRVTAASRSVAGRSWPDGVHQLTTDLRVPGAAAAACADAEVVVMAAQVPYPRWTRELPGLFDTAADAAAAVGARLVVVDNLYAYGAPANPIADGSPTTPDTRKGQLRAALAERLLDRHHRGEVRVTIGRFADYYGPFEGNSLVNQVMITPAVRGRRVRAYIAADQPHTFHYLPDAARGFAALVEHEEADGRSWILPAAPAITQGELIELLRTALQTPLRTSLVTRRMLWALGLVNAELREAREMVTQFDRPYVIDATDHLAAFGDPGLTPHADAVAATLAWARTQAGGQVGRVTVPR